MQDQKNLPESEPPVNNLSESELPNKKLNLFRDWWEEMYPHDFILTFKNYFFNHKQFFDEVFAEQWDNKVKPMAFLFTAVGVSLIIGSISPWGLNMDDEPAPPVAWREMQQSMSDEDRAAFVNTFQLQNFFSVANDSVKYSQAVDQRLMEVMGRDTPVTATQLKEYFESINNKKLATLAHYTVLKEQVAHNQYLKDTEIGEIEQVVYLNIFVLWCMFYWLIAHRLFKRAKRTSRETVFVFMYGLGMLIFLVYVPFIAISGALDDNVLTIGFLVVLVLLLLVLYRIFSIFKHTHNTGFINLMLVYLKTFLVAGLVGLLLFAGAFYLLDWLL